MESEGLHVINRVNLGKNFQPFACVRCTPIVKRSNRRRELKQDIECIPMPLLANIIVNPLARRPRRPLSVKPKPLRIWKDNHDQYSRHPLGKTIRLA